LLNATFSEHHRPIRLRLADQQAGLDHSLLVQRVQIREGVCSGIEAHLTCLSLRADLPLKQFIGLPVEVQLVTDRGELRRFCLIVTEARAGQSDGGFAVFQLSGSDAVALMRRRINSRVWRNQSVTDITHTVLAEWLSRSAPLARAFEVDFSRLDGDRYPAREFAHQYNESDAGFLYRLWKRAGISWVFEPAPSGPNATPRHRLVLFDDARSLAANVAGELRYHRDDATEQRDSITLWAPARQLVSGIVERSTWDYQGPAMHRSSEPGLIDQGGAGNELAAALADSLIEVPHAAEHEADHTRLTRLRMQRHEFEAKCVHGASGVRNLAAGQWNRITGHAELDGHTLEEREYLFIDVTHWSENNLPKEIHARVQSLLAGSEALAGWVGFDASRDESRRYGNRFVAVRRDTPVVPAFDPATDWPHVHPTTAVVVGPPGEEVHCDALGRVKVQFQGLEAEDHAHAQGAGASGSDRDSAWVRVDFGWAGAGYGAIHPLRVGMEVEVSFLGGDPDKPLITGVLYNAAQQPPRFSHRGGLPGNRFLSGVKSKEVQGARHNQMRLDDTPGQISAQLASEHGHSQLNLGYLTHPRDDGAAEARGEGAELRSDESVAIRSAKGMLLSAWKRLEASDGQLARTEYLRLMQECLDLFRSLGGYAAEHQGLPVDEESQAKLKSSVQAWEAGSNTEPKGQDGGEPIVAVTAPKGISLATPEALVSFAGRNVDTVAQQHMQYTAGQRFNLNAGQGVGLFAHHGGIQAIAHHGRWLMQSQHGDIEANASNNIKWTATNGELVGMAKKIVLIAEDGSFIQIGDGITLGTQGAIAQKASSFPHSGPATKGVDLPSFGTGSPDQKFVLRYAGSSDSLQAPTPAANRRYEITLSDGSTRSGRSDAQGATQLLAHEAMQIANIRILSD
jgi:type VI secretion system secreted protein VgrG